MKRKKKPKLLTGKRLTKRLDDKTRELLHLMHPYPTCFVEGNKHGWYHPKTNKQGCQVGHFIKRKYTQIRWDFKNLEPQSAGSNHLHNENSIPYTKAIIKAYGMERLNYLNKKQQEKPPTTLEKREILKDIEKRIEAFNINT